MVLGRAFLELGGELWKGWMQGGAFIGLYEWQLLPQDVWVAKDGHDARGKGQQPNPFKTVQHAIDVIVDKADNSMEKPYTVHVGTGVYSENVVLDSAKLKKIRITGETGFVEIDKLDVVGWDVFKSLLIDGLEVEEVSIIGKNDASVCFTSGLGIRDCLVDKLTVKNSPMFAFLTGIKGSGKCEIENVDYFTLVGGSMFEADPFTIKYISGNPKPVGMGYMKSWFAGGMVLNTPVLTGAGFLQINQGTRFGDSGVPLVLSLGQTLINCCSCCMCDVSTGGNPSWYVGYGGYVKGVT
ncbi:hypothetical protein KAX02_05470 [candidate division WOR-3 bacterium]|nr:hypothetical protein [candidate division WOR-3 bacterium]